jgi:hypothetical protein
LNDRNYRDYWTFNDLAQLLARTSSAQARAEILTSSAMRRSLVLESNKTQENFAAKWFEQILKLEKLSNYVIPLLANLTNVKFFTKLNNYEGINRVVAQTNSQLLIAFDTKEYGLQVQNFVVYIEEKLRDSRAANY